MNVKAETNIKAPPPPVTGHDWVMIDGDTTNIGDPTMATILYMHAYLNRDNTILTLAHEFAHQDGILDEDAAEAAGRAADDEYKSDGGAKCGGL